MAWDIRPHIGVGQLFFGESFEDVKSIIGGNGKIISDGNSFRYLCGSDKPVTIFDENLLVEASFGNWQLEDIVIGSVNLSVLNDREIISVLSDIENGPLYECFGFLLFLKLGISLSGYHDGDEAQKAITVFRKHHWDEFKSEMRLFSL